MTKLTDTQTLILTRASARPGNLALPLPEGLHGAAATMAIGRMIKLGFLEEVEANIQRGEPLWRETGDGHGTTLIATEVGQVAIGIDPVVVKALAGLRDAKPEAIATARRPGTKQALLIAMLQAPDGAPDEPTPTAQAEAAPPKPRFDFYTLLPEQTIEVETERTDVEPARDVGSPSAAGSVTEQLFLQAGSFRQRDDADRRRAQLLLLGLEPTVQETNGDNGRWFRVYLGPYATRAEVNRARGLTAAQDIDTLMLQRNQP